jgi:hypothetical protein
VTPLALAAKVNLDRPHTPRSTMRLATLTGTAPAPARPLMVEEDLEPVFAALVAEMGATWLGIAAPAPGGRVLADGEPGPVVPYVTQEATS